MKKLIFTFNIICFSFFVNAQPILTDSNFDLQSYWISHSLSGYLGLHQTGANVIWNFSSAQVDQSTYSTYSPVTPIEACSNFRLQRYYQPNNTNYYYDYDINSSGYYSNSNPCSTTSPTTILSFPLQYDLGLSGLGTYQGYGTLITPLGTFNDVVYTTLYTNVGGLQTHIDKWYLSSNLVMPIIYEYSAGGQQSSYYSCIISIPVSNLSTNTSKKGNFSIFPNPTNDDVTIITSDDFNDLISVSVFDFMGKEIIKNELLDSKSKSINFRNFSSGIYLVKFIDKNKNLLAIEKIIKK